MTEPVVKIPLSLAKKLMTYSEHLANSEERPSEKAVYWQQVAMLEDVIDQAEREASLDNLTAIGQSMGEYEK